jgi:hypothetical protein
LAIRSLIKIKAHSHNKLENYYIKVALCHAAAIILHPKPKQHRLTVRNPILRMHFLIPPLAKIPHPLRMYPAKMHQPEILVGHQTLTRRNPQRQVGLCEVFEC